MEKFTHTAGHIFNIGDADIYYETLGNPNMPTLILLHGGGGTIEDFNLITKELVQHYYVVGMDARGHGRSTIGSDRLTYQRLEDDVVKLVKLLKLDNVRVLGFSDGGILGYRLAASKKISIKKLITIGGTWSEDDRSDTADLLSKFSVEKWKELMPDSFRVFEKFNAKENAATNLENIKSMWLDDSETGYPNESVRLINCPTLIVRGDEDHLFSRFSAVTLSNLIKDASFCNIPFAAHGVIQEQKEIVMLVIMQFFNKD